MSFGAYPEWQDDGNSQGIMNNIRGESLKDIKLVSSQEVNSHTRSAIIEKANNV